VWRGRYFRDEAEKHGGLVSMRLENQAEDDVVQVSQNVDVAGDFRIGGTYRLSAWMRSEGLAKPNGINLGALTADLKGKGAWRIPMPTGGDWTRGEATFTVPKGTDFLRIMCHVDGPGKVWIDDMALEEVREDGTTVEVMRPDTPPDHEVMAQWVRLYSGEGRPYLLLGRMLHPPKLECGTTSYQGAEYPAILHNAYRAPDGSEAVVLMNATGDQQTGALAWHDRPIALELKPWEARLITE